MMSSSAADNMDFPPNPFRSNPTTAQPAAPAAAPKTMQQPQPVIEEHEDFFSNNNSNAPPSFSAPPQQQQQPLPSQPMSPLNNSNATIQHQQQSPTSWWQACRSCCSVDTYKAYFDVETADIKNRLAAVWTQCYKADAFRTETLEEKGPDLYGPFWVTMTLVFLLAVTSNIAAYLHTDNIEEYEYDIRHLIRAMSVLGTFALGVPSLFWVLTQCLAMQALQLVDWVCLYGYSLVFYLPATLLCLIPFSGSLWIWLSLATVGSALLVLRNVAGPLLASDVTQGKAGPIILGILGCHVIFLLVLRIGFYR